MKRYKINIMLSTGDEVQSTVVARNQSDALKRLERTPQYVNFTANAYVVSVDIEPIPIDPIDNQRFGVTNVTNKSDWYVVADLDNNIRVEWKRGKYNETQRVLPIGDGKPLTAQQGATVMREIGEYLYKYFPELL